MGQRRVLVIGSQCWAEQELSFLPKSAERFHAAMLDQEQGQCVPALPEGGLLLDPTVEEADQKIRLAYRRASTDQATLFLAFVGHGTRSDDDFYLLPKDAALPPTMRSAVYLVQLIREEFHGEPATGGALDGLVVLLDACSAGAGLPNVAARWVHEESKRSLRFELLTATGENPAYDGCFTRILTELLLNGDPTSRSPNLRTQDCTTPLFHGCRRQQPRVLVSSYGADRGLWLMRNRASAPVVEPWLRSGISDEFMRLTSYYQPPALLARIPSLLAENRAVAIAGPAGAGKSALVAALARPEVTRGVIPPGFLGAVVLLNANTTAEEVARFLASQLSQSVPGFAACLDEFETRTQHTAEWAGLDALQRKVIGPLRMLDRTQLLRIAVDSLDQAPHASLPPIIEFLTTLATDKALPFVRVILTARGDTPLPPDAIALSLDHAPEESLREYFGERKVPPERIEAAIVRADGNWLVAELLADLSERDPSDFDPAAIPPSLPRIYEAALQKAGASDLRRWREELRPVLGVLAVAGAGPVLPFPLFRRACQELEGPKTNSRLRDVLVDLRGFVIRVAPGGEEEQVGLFHATLAEHLLKPGHATSVESREGHQALLAAIETLAPVDQWDPRRPDANQSYAFRRHADHLWAVGRREEVMTCLAARTSNVPRENLDLWSGWLERFTGKFNLDHPDTLTIRNNIAALTGQAGEAREALRLFRELLPDRQRVLGADHPGTLTIRNNIASLTGQAGEAREALRLFRELLPDRRRVLGADHPDTLITRNNIAALTGQAGEAREALRLFRELLPDQRRVLGADHPDTLITRNNIASLTGQAGEAQEALRLFRELLPVCEGVLGPSHPFTITVRKKYSSLLPGLSDD